MQPFDFSGRRIRREAADWIARLGGEPNPEDLRRFHHWRDRDPRHAAAFSRMKAIWDGASQASRPPARQPALGRHQWGYALAAATAAFVAMLFLAPLRPSTPLLLVSTSNAGRSMDLADGTRLGLARDTSARVASTERRLEIEKGKILLLVPKRSEPFVIEVGQYEAVADGARLEVLRLAEEMTVTAIEGTVEVRSKGILSAITGKSWNLAPGERLVITGQGPRVERAKSGDVAMVEFDDARLADAVRAINRSSTTAVRLSSSQIGALRLSGAFRQGDAEGFARSAAAAFSLRVEKLADGSLLLTR